MERVKKSVHLKLIVDNTKRRNKDETDNVWGHVHKAETRGECEFCQTCQDWRDDLVDSANGMLACGHTEEEAIRHSRPCVFASCRYNLFLEVSSVGSIKNNFDNLEIDELEETCALDVADQEGTKVDVSERIGVTPQRMDQIVWKSLAKIKGGYNKESKHYMKVGAEIHSNA